MEEEKKYVYVTKSLADKIESAQSDRTKLTIIEDYIRESKNEIKSNLESLEEDVVIYKGLMIKAKEAFREVKEEQLTASYKVWEKFDEEMRSVSESVKIAKEKIIPLKKEIQEVNELLRECSTYNLKELLSIIKEISSELSYDSKTGDILKFLFKEYKKPPTPSGL